MFQLQKMYFVQPDCINYDYLSAATVAQCWTTAGGDGPTLSHRCNTSPRLLEGIFRVVGRCWKSLLDRGRSPVTTSGGVFSL